MKPLVIFAAMTLAAATNYPSEIAEWRHNREASLRSENGWLTLVGLFWLNEGTNDIPQPDGTGRVAAFVLKNGKVTLTAPGPSREVQPDSADVVKVGHLNLFLIKRGDKFGIRMKDPESETRRNFHGLEYFPTNEQYRITARWVAEPRKIPILNVLGQTEDSDCPGYAVFQLHGKELRLYPIIEEPGAKQLFYIFRDETAGKETYGAGRFLYSAIPQDGKVVLDFNKAYNPPCTFTPYATCPLPPKENRLPIRIEAGEKNYGH